MIDLRYVKKLIEMIDESSVDSIEITSDKGMKIRISKSPQQRGAVSVAAPISVPPMLPGAASPSATPAGGVPVIGDRSAGTEGEGAPPQPPRAAHLEVKSPMVGTFYTPPEPGAKPYVSIGDRIVKGQVLCIIEAMKIMNEIESEFAGIVREVSARDAHPVEYGQVLFRVDPNG